MTYENRCPNCGAWLSTRYSAGNGPHKCSDWDVALHGLAVQPANQRQHIPAATKPDLARLPMGPQATDHGPAGWPAGAFSCPPRYHGTKSGLPAPATAAGALVLAWVAGALAGGLVCLLVAASLWQPLSP